MKGDIFTEVRAQSERLGLPPGFYDRLVNEDDWSFVIKLNALVEAACSDALAARLHEPALVSLLATLDLGHPKHGKVALLKELSAINKEQAGVLRMVLELRNLLAHNVARIGFTFAEYIAAMDRQQRKSFVARAGYGIKPEFDGQTCAEFVLQEPKTAIWLTVAEILACLHLEHDIADTRLRRLGYERLKIPEPGIGFF